MKYDLSALLKQPPQKRKILTDALKRKIRAAGKDALAFNRYYV